MYKRIIIIDGYNLIKSPQINYPDSGSLEGQREHLLRILHSSSLAAGNKIIVVFDGDQSHLPRRKLTFRGIQVIYSPKNKKADDIIREMIRRDSARQEMEIVSSDREIQNSARDHGAQATDSHAFWKRIHSPVPPDPGRNSRPPEIPDRELTDKEVRKWLDIFKNGKPDENK